MVTLRESPVPELTEETLSSSANVTCIIRLSLEGIGSKVIELPVPITCPATFDAKFAKDSYLLFLYPAISISIRTCSFNLLLDIIAVIT